MSQTDPFDLNLPNPDRSQPRYRPLTLSTPVERPADWPAPPPEESDAFYSPPAGDWTTYLQIEPDRPALYDSQVSHRRRKHKSRTCNSKHYSRRYASPSPSASSDSRAIAAWRVSRKMRFYRHLKIYLIINVIIWLLATPGILLFHGHFWPVYMTLFWGLGLFFEYRRAFGYSEYRQRRMIDQEMRRIK